MMFGHYPRERYLDDFPREKVAWRTNRTSIATWRARIQAILVICLLFSIWYCDVPKDLFRRRWFRSPSSPYAYVTLLTSNPDHDNKVVPDSQDEYYIATRMMAYQLLHAPETRTNHSIPFIVLVTEDVAPHKVERLMQDGAMVKIVENITASWMKPREPRWRNMLSKLYIFSLTRYQKLLYLDADTLITRRLDNIFTDPTTTPKMTNPNLALADEGPLPETYMLAAQAAFDKRDHEYPPSLAYSATGHLSGGFFIAQPSQMIFEYYSHLIAMEGRFKSDVMEQDMLNYAHRRDGPMPWADVTYVWTSSWPGKKELQAGAATLHEKFWDEKSTADMELKKMWYTIKGEMEGYWKAREEMGP